jgi:hypothetical protein
MEQGEKPVTNKRVSRRGFLSSLGIGGALLAVAATVGLKAGGSASGEGESAPTPTAEGLTSNEPSSADITRPVAPIRIANATEIPSQIPTPTARIAVKGTLPPSSNLNSPAEASVSATKEPVQAKSAQEISDGTDFGFLPVKSK